MATHELYGLSVTALALILSLWRYQIKIPQQIMANLLHHIISVFLCVLLILGADLGGLMVYKHGVGVETVIIEADSHEHMQDT